MPLRRSRQGYGKLDLTENGKSSSFTVRLVLADSTMPAVTCTNLSPSTPEAAGSRSSAMARWKSAMFLVTRATKSGSQATVVFNVSLDTRSSPCSRGH